MTTSTIEKDSSIPPGPILFITMVTDMLIGYVFPEWRSWLPFNLGTPPSGLFSHDVSGVLNYFRPLPSYREYLQSSSQGINFQSLQSYAFSTPSTALGDLSSPTAIMTVFVLVLFFRKIKYSFILPTFTARGLEIGMSTHGKGWVIDNQERIVKFAEYCLRLMYHFTISAFGIYYFWDKPWWNPEKGGTKTLFIGFPEHTIDVGMIWYYLVQCIYNIEALVSLLELSLEIKLQNPLTHYGIPLRVGWSKTCRGDVREMFIHHVITNMLILISSTFRFTRIGSMVFLVHDISDVPVDLSKLANFLKWKKTTISFFVTMIIVWLGTRMIIFPSVIVRSVFMETKLLMIENGGIVKQVHHDAW
eukprot:CAMPEP_0197824990 /NCGR_PEP_ID=MMETSP1437-20131217/2147_1 /TAXON_ID=49252 ORGANISM="Eucampia antarctica, Strain CCMP1452" /NCGR_SAMPLE_ID=MMETSP1437 /ASSEMBLY_ACC=CAM_ASM_001096 /LENGTH=359 /DNA_ID=CAMNT_0043424815 /DNA_START=39 /DNA_END=1115 /DNA_ORIENTATION=+